MKRFKNNHFDYEKQTNKLQKESGKCSSREVKQRVYEMPVNLTYKFHFPYCAILFSVARLYRLCKMNKGASFLQLLEVFSLLTLMLSVYRNLLEFTSQMI